MKYEIYLFDNDDKNNFIKYYDNDIIPNIGDGIVFNETEVFLVRKRMLTVNTNKIVLYGNVISGSNFLNI